MIGKTRAFDGAVLFLPKKLDEDVCMQFNKISLVEHQSSLIFSFVYI